VWFLGAGIITLVGGSVMLVGLVSLTA